MSEEARALPEGMSLVQPPRAWARAVTDFDSRAFGRDRWSYDQWVYELSESQSVYRAFVAPPGISAIPEIFALGGVSLGPEAEILTIAVAPALRGSGLGRRMLAILLDIAREDGAEQVFLEVRSRGEVARSLYRSVGFVDVGRRKAYYGDDDAIIMRLDIV